MKLGSLKPFYLLYHRPCIVVESACITNATWLWVIGIALRTVATPSITAPQAVGECRACNFWLAHLQKGSLNGWAIWVGCTSHRHKRFEELLFAVRVIRRINAI